MASGDIYSAVLHFNLNNAKGVVCWHYRQTAADGTYAPEADLADLLSGAMVANLMHDLPTSVSHLGTTLRCLHPTPRQGVFFGANNIGSIAGITLPPGSAVLVSLYGETNTPAGRNRFNLSGISSSDVDNSNLSGTRLNSIASHLETILGPLLGGAGQTDFEGVVWSSRTNTAELIKRIVPHANIRIVNSRRVGV